ncbi:DNA sulfur modification protein DndB [Robertmurraya massiliosenegalensis]|uniref:DNA sulfur modification protein DndB n=1 Tax=Robertmurraya TaxID=2837507 RepID=UPI0039A67AEF
MDLSNLMGKSNFLVLKALKGYQFDKEILSMQCIASQIIKFIQVDRSVQRDIIDQHVAEIQQYIQYGVDGHPIYFPPLILSARGKGNYDNENQEYHLDFDEKLILLDGQHRMKAFEMVIKRLEIRDDMDSKRKLDFVRKFPLTLQIFTNISTDEEKQLFTDVNTKSSKVNNTLLIMYKNQNLCGELVKEVIENHPTVSPNLFEVRAKYTKTKFMTAATLYNIVVTLNEGLIHTEMLKSKITSNDYEEYKSRTIDFLKLLYRFAPISKFNRSEYIIYIPKVLSGIAYFTAKTLEKYPNWNMEDVFTRVIRNINWSHNNLDFKDLGMPYNENTHRYNVSSGVRAIKIIAEYLNKKLEEGEKNELRDFKRVHLSSR